MKSIIVNNILLILVSLICLNCKRKDNNDNINILKLSDLNNYKITNVKVNDSINRILGENNNYSIEGKMDLLTHSKQGWWKIKSKKDKNRIEIEYISLDKEFENQIRIYNNEVFDSNSSKFYNASFRDNNYLYTFHFPKSNYITYNVEFEYIISDTFQKKKVREGILKLKKKKDYYFCDISTKENENVIGIVTKLSKFKKKDSIIFAIDRMFIKPLKNNNLDKVNLNNPQ